MSGFGGSLSLDIGGLATGIMNYKAQKKQLQYQKQLQKQIFAREDNAHQRAVADLRAAGLSPTLAAGSASNAGQVVSTEAPQIDLGDTGKASTDLDALGLLTMRKNIEKVGLENELLKSKRVEADASTLDKKASARKKAIETRKAGYDLGIAEKSGSETNPGNLIRTARGLATTLDVAYRNQTQAIEQRKQENQKREGKKRFSTSTKPPRG